MKEESLTENNKVRSQGYSFQLVNIECLPSSDNFNVIMELEDSIEDLLPFLATTLPGCTYVHESKVVNLMDAGHIVAIYPDRITITDVKDEREAQNLCVQYFQKIAHVQANRASISPTFEKRLSLSVLTIYQALPKTNCGQCGSPTCMAFAARIFRRKDTIGKCEPVMNEKDNYRKLLDSLTANGYEIQ